MTELIIAEKPSAAKKIAEALADGKAIKESYKAVPYYRITHGSRDIVVAAAVGHLYSLAEKNKKGMKYPSFDVEWKPIYEVEKGAAFSKKYIDTLKKLCKDADSFVIACDYDIEGTTIGLNVLRYICRQPDAKRMKFSTLTREELRQAYGNAAPHLDWGQAHAGETRHVMDWYYGINLSRAMTSAIKKGGMFKILSAGRVQGPALKIVVDREAEIRAFKPEPFWQIELQGNVRTGQLTAWHEADKFWKEEEAKAVMEKCRNKDGRVDEVKTTEFRQAPPVPFDLTTLQTEAYRCFGINPKRALEIAQDLYTAGYISYPRTSSQQLPPAIGFANILKQLAKQKNYADLCERLLGKTLQPNNGKKTDPAHPAVFPTGIVPKALDERRQKVYDLVVRRFMATFGEPAVRETVTVKVNVAAETFIAKGTTTKVPGWHVYYGPYVKLKEEELPKVVQNETVESVKLTKHDRETAPPKRYTMASLVRELEKRNLGTKATRAQVVDTLINRSYVTGKALEATDLGMRLVEVLGRHVPDIVDEELTRKFELEMEEIQEKDKKGEEVLEAAKTVLVRVLDGFRKKEKEIGEGLFEATKESEDKANTVGPCPKCKEGTLMIKKGKFGRFIACGRYPDCEATFKLPAGGMVKNTGKSCEQCGYPMVLMIRKARKPQEACINLDCPAKKIEGNDEGKPCPKCKEGKLVIRKSVYGQFLACGRFPKCRNIIR